jgi:UDP-N-acetylmuramate dehydrogenase
MELSRTLGILRQSNLSIEENVSAASFNTYRVGGDIACLLLLRNLDDIHLLSEMIAANQGMFESIATATIGKGSNVIVSDEPYEGVVISLTEELAEFTGKIVQSPTSVFVSAYGGVSLPTFARQCAPLGIAGLEFYVGIPGSIGGAVAMNAGGHGRQTSEVLASTDVLDLHSGELKSFSRDECEFGYRTSRFTNTDVIFSAQFIAALSITEEIKNSIDEIVSWRRENQPGGRNVGSVFQNPEEASAGQLIEEAGLKGFRIGGAHISEKHANFIQADEGATASDILQLIAHIQKVVMTTTSIALEPEVRYIAS